MKKTEEGKKKKIHHRIKLHNFHFSYTLIGVSYRNNNTRMLLFFLKYNPFKPAYARRHDTTHKNASMYVQVLNCVKKCNKNK